ncbi:MAG: ABC transporter ATP-binding protein [Planctomycetia bacterium]|nr:ABC transporter ATP-binding protein [Planctomycetia bacterium]
MSETAIEVNELTFAHGSRRALDGVSFRVSLGERVGLVGPNGAGKTSLFLCLAGVLRPQSGTVRVCGLDVRAERRGLPRCLGIVFQDSDDQLFNSSVHDDVAFGPLNLGLEPGEVRKRVSEALQRVGMSGQEARVPMQLSGGEKRRIALAGVLAMRPEVLLLDEPTMFLDPRGRRELIGLLREVAGTQLVASHDLEFIRELCPRIMLLDGGKVIVDGPTDSILADSTLMNRHGLEVPWSLR